MYYSPRHCLYSKTANGDLSTVLPLTATSGGKPPCSAHSAHVPLSRAEQLKAAPSFPVAPPLPNEAHWRFLHLFNLDHTGETAGRSSSRAAL